MVMIGFGCADNPKQPNFFPDNQHLSGTVESRYTVGLRETVLHTTKSYRVVKGLSIDTKCSGVVTLASTAIQWVRSHMATHKPTNQSYTGVNKTTGGIRHYGSNSSRMVSRSSLGDFDCRVDSPSEFMARPKKMGVAQILSLKRVPASLFWRVPSLFPLR